MKKRSERRKHCILAVVRRSPKNFVPPKTPFPGAQDGRNLISWRWSLHLPRDTVWWTSMHAISSYLGNRPTDTSHPKTHTNTRPPARHRQDRQKYTAPLSLARSVIKTSSLSSICTSLTNYWCCHVMCGNADRSCCQQVGSLSPTNKRRCQQVGGETSPTSRVVSCHVVTF